MTSAASGALAVTKALERVVREDRGRLLSALIAKVRDFQLAEEALQDAITSALVHWSRTGLPSSPQGWLLTVAYRKALRVPKLKRVRISPCWQAMNGAKTPN
jgi:predicted RNA polymerase sigma factor